MITDVFLVPYTMCFTVGIHCTTSRYILMFFFSSHFLSSHRLLGSGVALYSIRKTQKCSRLCKREKIGKNHHQIHFASIQITTNVHNGRII